MKKHLLTMSATDVLEKATTAFDKGDLDAQRDAANMVLENDGALKLMDVRMEHSSSIDVALMSRILSTRCYELREEYEEDRPKLWFMDLFRERNLFFEIRAGIQGYVSKVYDYTSGPVRFIGDKTDDWPTAGDRTYSGDLKKVKYFANSVEYGILELWQASCDGRDIIRERVENAFRDHDEFVECLIAMGAINHGIYGFMNHPSIPQVVAPATLGPLAPATDWPSKSPEEIMFDLRAAVDLVRSGSNYSINPDTAIVSDQRFSYAGVTQIGTNGDTILGRWANTQANTPNGGLQNIVPFVPYDNAGPGGTPIMTAGTFDSRYLEMGLMPARQLATEYHGAKWKIGFIGAAGSVDIKRPNRFVTMTGI